MVRFYNIHTDLGSVIIIHTLYLHITLNIYYYIIIHIIYLCIYEWWYQKQGLILE